MSLNPIFHKMALPVFAFGAMLASNVAIASIMLDPGDVAISDCAAAACIDVNAGAGNITLNPVGSTSMDIEIDFGGEIVLDDPGFGPPPFPGFPSPSNPWAVTLTFATTGNNPGITWPLNNGDLVFTTISGGAADVAVLADNIKNQLVTIAGGVLTYQFDVLQSQAGLAPGVGFGDFHMLGVQFNLGDNATLALQQVMIEPASTIAAVAAPEPGTVALVGLGLLGVAVARRRKLTAF